MKTIKNNTLKFIIALLVATFFFQPATVLASVRTQLDTITISFHANGGQNAPRQIATQRDPDGAIWFDLPSQVPTKDGYVFAGWRIKGDISTATTTPGETIGIYTGRRGVNESFLYIATWKCSNTSAHAASFDAAELMARGLSYSQIQVILEDEVFRLVNIIRADYGLNPLVHNRDLATVARHRAQESTQYGYITGHISHATGLAHTDHARAKGLDVAFAGENWGGHQRTPEEIVEAWMASPSHRDFLLSGHASSRFTNSNVYMAVGVAFCAQSGFVSNKNWTLWQSR